MIHTCIDPGCFFEKQICAIWGINVLLNNSNPEYKKCMQDQNTQKAMSAYIFCMQDCHCLGGHQFPKLRHKNCHPGTSFDSHKTGPAHYWYYHGVNCNMVKEIVTIGSSKNIKCCFVAAATFSFSSQWKQVSSTSTSNVVYKLLIIIPLSTLEHPLHFAKI